MTDPLAQDQQQQPGPELSQIPGLDMSTFKPIAAPPAAQPAQAPAQAAPAQMPNAAPAQAPSPIAGLDMSTFRPLAAPQQQQQTQQPAGSSAWEKFKSRMFEPVTMEEIEQGKGLYHPLNIDGVNVNPLNYLSQGLNPQTVQTLHDSGQDTLGSIFGKEHADYIQEHILHGFTPEVMARAALKTLTDWYSPAQIALSVPARFAHGYATAAAAAEKVGLVAEANKLANKARLAASLGLISGVPFVGKQLDALLENWEGMSPPERAAAVSGVLGGGLMMGVGVHEGGGPKAVVQPIVDAAAEAAAATGKAVAAPFKAAGNAVADANLVQRATGPSGTLRKLFYDAIKPSSANAREVDETLGRVEPELNRIFEDNPQVKDTPSAVAVLDREINRFGDTEKQIADNLTGDPANPNPESLMAGAKDKISAAIDNAFKGDQWGSEAQEAAKAKMLARYSDITANNGLDESEHRERTLPELQKLTRQLGQETQSKYDQADTSGEGTHLDKTTADWAARDAAARVGRELIDQKFEDLGVQGVKEWRQKQADLINVKQWLDARYGASTKKFDWFQKSIQAVAITGAGMGTGALLGPYVGIPIASVGAVRLAREYAEYRANNPDIALGRGVQRAGIGPRGPDGKPTNISKPYGPYIKDMTGQELRISSPTPDKTIEAAAVKGPQTQLAPVPRSFVEAQPGQQPSIFGGQVGEASALRSPANVDMEQLKNMVFDKLARGEQLRLTPEQIQAWWKTYGSMPPSPTAEKGQMELSPVPNSLVPVVPSPVAAEGDVLDPNKPDYTGATGAPHPSVFAEPGTLPPARPDVTPTPEELGNRPAEVQPKPIREGEVPHRQIPPRLIGRNGSTVSTVAHEYGHAAGPVFFGVGKAGEIRTWEHQTNRARGAAAATQYNFGDMWVNGKWHADKIGSQFNNIMGVLALGGAAEEVLHGIPMKENAGLAGDHQEMRKLMQTLGITDPYQQKTWIETAHRNAVAKFQQPGVPAIFNEFASGRDPQTGRTLHATAARVAEFQDRLREAINGDTRSTEGEAGSGGRSGGPDGVDDGLSGPAAGSAEGQTTSQLLSANGSEAGRDRGTGEAERALAPKDSPVGPQAATGQAETSPTLRNPFAKPVSQGVGKIADKLGLRAEADSMGLVYFTGADGNTFVLPADKVTPETVQAKIDALKPPSPLDAKIDDLYKKIRASGVDLLQADDRARQLVEADNGAPNYSPVERQLAKRLLDHYMGRKVLGAAAVAAGLSAFAKIASAQDKKKPLPNGMLSVGNIDVNHRPVIRNADGSVSTIFSATIPLDKDGNVWRGDYEKAPQYALVPTIADGKFLTPDGKLPNELLKTSKATDRQKEAVRSALEDAATARYQQTKQHLGIFKSGKAADDFANATHDWLATGGPEKVFLPTPKAKASEWFQKDGQWIRHTPDGRLETRSSKPRTQTHTSPRQ